MVVENKIVNRVAKSSLVTFDLEEYYDTGKRVLIDIKDYLYQGLILREKEFRSFVKEHDWTQYKDGNIAINCSSEAIIPVWAYMLVTTKLTPYAKNIVLGTLDDLEKSLFQQALSRVNPEEFEGAKIVIKGCGNFPVPDSAYVEITRLLAPYASSIMYGEPCSTVPIYKKPRN